MSNNINWGRMYDYSYWGVGVGSNTISWGKDYEAEALSFTLVNSYINRVSTDGGTIESISCLRQKL